MKKVSKIKVDDLVFTINEEEKTASLIGTKNLKNVDIIIPRAIFKEKQEYLVTTIKENSFRMDISIKSIQVASSSELKVIEKNAFIFSEIESLAIPSNIELQEGWCNNLSLLKKITIIPCAIQKIISYEDKFIIGKTDPKSDTYDNLLFVNRDVESVTIPPFIKKISTSALANMKITSIFIPQHVIEIGDLAFSASKLQHIEYDMNSELRKISKTAFYYTNIETITVPSTAELKSAFQNSINKYNIKIQTIPNKRQKIICYEDKFILGKTDPESDIYDILISVDKDIETVAIPHFIHKISLYSFSCSSVSSITIPQHVTKICHQAFNYCINLKKIEFEKNSELKIIGSDAFSYAQIESITIPASVTHICNSAFSQNPKLKQIDFEPNSELQFIGAHAFPSSPAVNISLPTGIEIFEDGWIQNSLINIVALIPSKKQNIINYEDTFILGKSDLNKDEYDVIILAITKKETVAIPPFIKKISSNAFSDNCYVKKVIISPHVKEIGSDAFFQCEELQVVEFQQNSELQIIGKNAFIRTNINRVFIPPSVIEIGESAFYECDNLQLVEIPYNSQLQIIGKESFSGSQIRRIFIPQHVKVICEEVFAIHELEVVVFHPLSELQVICRGAFARTSIKSILIPPHVQKIGTHAFYGCGDLQLIEIDHSTLELIGTEKFEEAENSIIMVQKLS